MIGVDISECLIIGRAGRRESAFADAPHACHLQETLQWAKVPQVEMKDGLTYDEDLFLKQKELCWTLL